MQHWQTFDLLDKQVVLVLINYNGNSNTYYLINNSTNYPFFIVTIQNILIIMPILDNINIPNCSDTSIRILKCLSKRKKPKSLLCAQN